MQPVDESSPPIEIWRILPFPEDYEKMYFFSNYSLNCNYLPDVLRKKVPHTDSRHRPDQRALEQGELKLATDEKTRIEDKQRTARKKEKKDGTKFIPVYFDEYQDEHESKKEKAFRFNGKYWIDRENGDWSHLPDLFGKD